MSNHAGYVTRNVDPIDKGDALALLQKKLGSGNDATISDLEQLAATLEYLP